jgi:hypothetical protein
VHKFVFVNKMPFDALEKRIFPIDFRKYNFAADIFAGLIHSPAAKGPKQLRPALFC